MLSSSAIKYEYIRLMATDKRPRSLSILRIYGGIDNWTDVHKQIESIPDLRTMGESVDIGLTYTRVAVWLLTDQEREQQKIRRSGAGRGFRRPTWCRACKQTAPNKSWGYGSNKLNEEGQILVACYDRAQESGYAPMIFMVDGLFPRRDPCHPSAKTQIQTCIACWQFMGIKLQ
ncbi:hypothetical protein SAMN05216308_101128 [Nitrosospira sp. Nsp13]|nr:hypothetical protein SAMN05216308_101128 [Nitrosospira sp. Nsp13]